MGNVMNFMPCCTPASKTVRVYQDKGRIMEYYYPVPAAKLMEEYPKHLLVFRRHKSAAKHRDYLQSPNTMNRKAISQHVDIRVVRSTDTLQLGHVYFLVHIPDQYIMRFAKYFNIKSPRDLEAAQNKTETAVCKSSPEINRIKSPRRSKAVRRQRRSPLRKNSEGWGASNGRSDATPPRSRGRSLLASRRPLAKKYARKEWKPALESISEDRY